MSDLVRVNPNKLTTAASIGASVADKSSTLLGMAKNFIAKGMKWFGNLHPAAKAVAVAGTALVALNAVSGSKHPAAQRVAD